jgi:ABC-type multidrug transport system fused ATPase/permease subunit
MRGGMGHRFGSNGEKFNIRKLNKQALAILKNNLKGQGKNLFVAITLTLIISASHTILPLLTKTAIDDHIVAKQFNGLVLVVIAYIVVALIQWFTSSWQMYLARKIAYNVITSLRNEIYSHLIKLDINFHNNNKVGDISSVIMNDVETLYNLISQGFVYFISDLITIIAIAISLYLLNSKLAVILLISMPIIIFITNLIGKLLRKAQQQVRKNIAKLTTGIEQNISGVRAVKTFAQETTQNKKVEELSQQARKANIKSTAISALLFPIMDLAGAIGLALVIWQGGLLYAQNAISLGVLMAAISYSRRIYGPLMDLSQIYTTYQTAAASLDRVYSFIKNKPNISYLKQDMQLKDSTIELNKVSFAYEENQEHILENLDFTIASGEKIGIIGPSGVGKSTIIKLISRQYDPLQGIIRIGDIPLKSITKTKLRNMIQVIPQDTYLFPVSVWENIAYGLQNITKQDVEKIIKNLQLNEFFDRLDNGLDSLVGENGKTLSGGQRQAIAITRAMVRNPKILILDEAASNLDPQIEQLIYSNTKKLWQDKTIIIVTHRTTSLKLVDKVYEIKDKKLVEINKEQVKLAGW